MRINFNKSIFPINKLPMDVVNCVEFHVQAYNGLQLKFQRLTLRTSLSRSLQYDVFDEKGNRIANVRYHARFFVVFLYGERVLEMVCDDGELESWLDWQFVDWATTVIAAGYRKIGMQRERVRER